MSSKYIKYDEGNKGKTFITNKIIRQFPESQNYSEYLNKVLVDFKFVKEFFPFLNICMLPTVKPKELFIYGWLVPYDLCCYLDKNTNIDTLGIYILAHYPSEYPDKDIEVEDICRSIDWINIPEKHRHIKCLDGRETGLCTHHPYGEINDVPKKHRTVKILASAWKIYYQYKQYIGTKNWELQDLPHGNEALRILKNEGYIKYNKKL